MCCQVRPCRFRFCHTSFFSLLFPHLFRHRFGEAYQAGILSAAREAEMADIEQKNKIVPFVACEIFFSQHVCELVFVSMSPSLNFRIKISLFKQPIKRNSVDSGHVSPRWTSSFDNHFDDSFIVFKNVQLRLTLRRMCVGGYVIHIRQLFNLFLSFFSWCLGLGFCLAQISLLLSWLGLTVLLVERNTSITMSQRSRAEIPSMRRPA